MRRSPRTWCPLILIGLSLTGCGDSGPKAVAPVEPPAPAAAEATPAVAPAVLPAGLAAAQPPTDPPPAPDADAEAQARYEAALWRAFDLIAEKKFDEALASFETARKARDTETVRREIERLKLRIDQESAADKTTSDIQTILAEGKPEDAAKLAAEALLRFGDGPDGERLASLKRQAEALLAASAGDRRTHLTRYRQEADTALREKNLRPAALALEQALAQGDDADLRRQLDEVRTKLTRYDEGRRRAAELRRDPERAEEALAALRDAAAAWDTLQVRNEMEECETALRHRRDR